MPTPDILTEQERKILRNVPFSVGIAIILCDYGAIGSIFETLSLATQLKNVERRYPNNPLLRSLFASNLTKINREISQRKKEIKHPEKFIQKTLTEISLAIEISSQKALPSEVQEYKQFIYLCGEKVAQASGEGLLGIGEKVSQPESSLLGEIKTQLKLSNLELASPLGLHENDLTENISLGELLVFLFSAERWLNTLHGIFFVTLFSLASYHIASFQIVENLKLSPVIIGLLLGVIYTNTLGQNLPLAWIPGINFCKTNILNLAIIFYGVKLTFQDLMQVGAVSFLYCFLIVVSTLVIAFTLGKFWFGLDGELALLIAAGSSICGSAAILATGSIIDSKPYKNIIAVAITFLFGTAGMFLFPLGYRLGALPINEDLFGIFLGATLPSVGNVAAAGSAISDIVEKNAIIIKMMRVMMLVPFLMLVGLYKSNKEDAFKQRHVANAQRTTQLAAQSGKKILVPWFAIFFIVTIVVNSLFRPPTEIVDWINSADKFGLTMAMTALGIETSAKKIHGVGLKPIYLGFMISVWLVAIGLFVVTWVR
ncbi:MAG: YeiH family protein [Phormidesmis sp.]